MSQTITLDQVLNEDFFTLVGLQSLPDSEKAEMLKSMNETVLARAYLRFTELLSPDQIEKLEALTSEEFFPFLQEQGIDVASIITEEAIKYRVELVGIFTMTTGNLAPA